MYYYDICCANTNDRVILKKHPALACILRDRVRRGRQEAFMSFMSPQRPQRLDLRIRVIHDWDMGLGPVPIESHVPVMKGAAWAIKMLLTVTIEPCSQSLYDGRLQRFDV